MIIINNFTGIGRAVRDPELRYIPSGTAVVKFTIAIDRNLSKEKKAEAEQKGYPTADFINITAWSKTAEFISNYLKKGKLVGIEGRIQTGSYDKEGTKVYTTEIVAHQVKILEWEDKQDNANNDFNTPDGFHNTDNNNDIPF